MHQGRSLTRELNVLLTLDFLFFNFSRFIIVSYCLSITLSLRRSFIRIRSFFFVTLVLASKIEVVQCLPSRFGVHAIPGNFRKVFVVRFKILHMI